VKIGTGDEFLRTTGGTLSGALTISTAAAQPLIINRSDASDGRHLIFQRGGITQAEIAILNAEPKLRIRDSGANERLTLDASTGLLGTALIPLSLMRRDQVGTSNVGAVTILVGMTTLVSLATTVDVAIGDRILVTAVVNATKGATGGNIYAQLVKSAGTSAGFFHQAAAALLDERNVPAGLLGRASVCGVWLVTVAGTLTFTWQASSAGSNSTVGIGGAEVRYWVMRDSP
jgi:hypothetical protein